MTHVHNITKQSPSRLPTAVEAGLTPRPETNDVYVTVVDLVSWIQMKNHRAYLSAETKACFVEGLRPCIVVGIPIEVYILDKVMIYLKRLLNLSDVKLPNYFVIDWCEAHLYILKLVDSFQVFLQTGNYDEILIQQFVLFPSLFDHANIQWHRNEVLYKEIDER